MWSLLEYILLLIIQFIEFIHWLVYTKLTNWENERLRRMGVGSQEELDEIYRQRYAEQNREIEMDMELEKELEADARALREWLDSYPQKRREVLRPVGENYVPL